MNKSPKKYDPSTAVIEQDILEMEDNEKHYHHFMDKDGNLLRTNLLTGEVVQTSPRFEDGLIPGKQMDPHFIKGNSRYWHYSAVYKDLIANHIAEGKTLSAISKLPGMPSTSIIAQWRAKHPELEDAIRAARKQQADFYADKIADQVDETRELSKDEIPAEKLYYEKLKWLAEKADPDQYGNRTKISGDADAPLTLVVDTGIRRDKPKEIDNIVEAETVSRENDDE